MTIENEVVAAPVETVAAPEVVSEFAVGDASLAPESVAVEPVVAATDAPAAEPVVTEAEVPVEPKSDFKSHTDEKTLIEKIGQEEPKATEAETPADVVTEVKTPLVYEDFQLPEGIVSDSEKMGAYKEVLGKHGVSQEAAQEFVNLHAESLQQYANHLQQEQHRVFAETRKGWQSVVISDPQIGGAGHETSMRAVARARDLLCVNPTDRSMDISIEDFNNMVNLTGVGDHPIFLKLLHNAARRFDEPAVPAERGAPPPNNGKPGPRRLSDTYDKRS